MNRSFFLETLAFTSKCTCIFEICPLISLNISEKELKKELMLTIPYIYISH